MNEKIEYLSEFFTHYGDFELFYVKEYDTEKKKAVPGWTSWKKYSECTDEEKAQANLRGVLKEEIVLDIEEPEKLEPIKNQLRRTPTNFLCFNTGSRGFHIHIIFDELKNKDNNEVLVIKERIIKFFGCDISKKAEKNLIALEYEPHFKTGKLKSLESYQNDFKNNLGIFLALTIKLSDLKNTDPKFFSLYEKGSWEEWGFPSRSEAEMSLCTTLARAGFNEQEIYHAMENSAVGKWQEKPASYKEMTIRKAIQTAAENPLITETIIKEPMFKFFEEFGIPEPITWLMPQYIPATGVTILSGKAGSGKSFLVHEMICAITQKRKFCNKFDIATGRPIILVDMENDHSLLYDRITKLGGVPEKQLYVFNFNIGNFDMQNNFLTDILFKAIEELDPVMVIFDTLRRTYSGDENNSQIINDIYRTVLQPIARERCCLLIAHTRKGNAMKLSDDDLSEIRGTGDITGLASSVLLLKPNVDKTITVKPIKLRCDKLPNSFVVKINEVEDNLNFEVLDTVEEKTEVEIISDKILDWMIHNLSPMTNLKTKELIFAMEKEGFNKRNIQRAIPLLCNRGYLRKEARGKFLFNYGDDSLMNYG